MEKYGSHRKNNMIVDLSPFFFFEAAGDSEGDLDHHQHHHMMMVLGLGGGHGNNEEDDAQSCSYGAWDVHHHHRHHRGDANAVTSHNINEGNEACRATAAHNSTIIYHHHHYDDDDDDGKSYLNPKKNSKEISCSREDYYKGTSSEVMSTANSNSSRKSCIDSSEGKKMSEKERSRLFWETCLAS